VRISSKNSDFDHKGAATESQSDVEERILVLGESQTGRSDITEKSLDTV
jgi:hypothetical protein